MHNYSGPSAYCQWKQNRDNNGSAAIFPWNRQKDTWLDNVTIAVTVIGSLSTLLWYIRRGVD